MGKWEDALRCYKESLNIGLPRLAYSQYMIGVSLINIGYSDDSIEAFEKTLDIDPMNISSGIYGYYISKKIGIHHITNLKVNRAMDKARNYHKR
ncbi:tetratricopeptide repeat protein [Vibrio sp. PP-XX7]